MSLYGTCECDLCDCGTTSKCKPLVNSKGIIEYCGCCVALLVQHPKTKGDKSEILVHHAGEPVE